MAASTRITSTDEVHTGIHMMVGFDRKRGSTDAGDKLGYVGQSPATALGRRAKHDQAEIMPIGASRKRRLDHGQPPDTAILL